MLSTDDVTLISSAVAPYPFAIFAGPDDDENADDDIGDDMDDDFDDDEWEDEFDDEEDDDEIEWDDDEMGDLDEADEEA